VNAGAASTLLRLLAVPLLLCAVLVAAWAMGESPAARVANAHLVLAIAGPFGTMALAITTIIKGSDAALVLPMPLMQWLVFSSQRASALPWLALLLAHGGVLMLLVGCWQRRRRMAVCGAVACALGACWLQLSPAPG
jgi:succinate-acetate transporter protein